MVTLIEKQTQILIAQPQKEWQDDHEYNIRSILLDMLEDENADPQRGSLQRNALGDKKEINFVLRKGIDRALVERLAPSVIVITG